MMMQTFVAALSMVAVQASDYFSINVAVDGYDYEKFVQQIDWFEHSTGTSDGNGVTIPNNSQILLKNYAYDGQAYAFKPYLRGGSIQYTVDLSGVNSGCATGVYAVALDNNCDEWQESDSSVSCPYVDIMQANPYGFETTVHACVGEGCSDPASTCQYNMRTMGVETYGEDAYGPSGTLVDTDSPFTIKTEFISTSDYATLWSIRTTISQGSNDMVLEANCEGFISQLDNHFEGGMGYIFSTWDNTDSFADFESEGQTNSGTCDNATTTISDIIFKQYDSNFDKDAPQELTQNMKQFFAESDYWGGAWDFTVLSLADYDLTTDGTQIDIGLNNRAWVLDFAYDDSTYWCYWHQYIGGTLKFDVNVNDVGCECAAGVFLAELNDSTCSWTPLYEGEVPQCASIDIMEANAHGFVSALYPTYSNPDSDSKCNQNVLDGNAQAYGPGSEFDIDTTQSYQVAIKFYAHSDMYYADQSLDDEQHLSLVRTTLTQGSKIVDIDMDCPEDLQAIQWKLASRMAMGIATYSVGTDSNISGDSCTQTCETASFVIDNVKWTSEDSLTDSESVNVNAGATPRLDSGDCGQDCSECIYAYQSNDLNRNTFILCNDTAVYKFTNECDATIDDTSKCQTDADQRCFMSYSQSDYDRKDSSACRTVPDSYINGGSYRYGNKDCWTDEMQGLCPTECTDACFMSYPFDDKAKWNSVKAMCRCMNSPQ